MDGIDGFAVNPSILTSPSGDLYGHKKNVRNMFVKFVALLHRLRSERRCWSGKLFIEYTGWCRIAACSDIQNSKYHRANADK